MATKMVLALPRAFQGHEPGADVPREFAERYPGCVKPATEYDGAAAAERNADRGRPIDERNLDAHGSAETMAKKKPARTRAAKKTKTKTADEAPAPPAAPAGE